MLPKNFEWLRTIGKLPYMVEEGIKLIGIKEVPGPTSNPQILEFAKFLKVDNIYKNDDTAWCALAQNYIAVKSGKKVEYRDAYDFIRALSFAKLGKEVCINDWTIIPLEEAMFGDSLVFKRPDGGHDAVYIGESSTHFIVMGGNQNNMYGFTRVAKERLVAVRRPKYIMGLPESVKKYFLTNEGVPATTNEK